MPVHETKGGIPEIFAEHMPGKFALIAGSTDHYANFTVLGF
jgi:hypothetical protein